MVFAHDTEVALAAMAALVNTEQPDGDRLEDLAALDAFVAEWRYTGRRDRDAAELDAVSKNRSRRFCDATFASRTNVAACRAGAARRHGGATRRVLTIGRKIGERTLANRRAV